MVQVNAGISVLPMITCGWVSLLATDDAYANSASCLLFYSTIGKEEETCGLDNFRHTKVLYKLQMLAGARYKAENKKV